MKTIKLNKKYYDIPTEWNELQPGQLLKVMATIYLKNYRAEQMLLRLLQVLTGLSDAKFFKVDVEELEEFFYLLAFLLREDIDFTKNILPLYHFTDANGGQKTFYGPADTIENLRMQEFHFTETFYTAWYDSEKKDDEPLNELIAILYRPMKEGYDAERNPAGDLREPFNQNVCSYNAKHYIASWPPSVKLAIAAWYNGCRRQLIANYDELFGGTGEPARFGLVSIMLNVAKDHAFGKFPDVENEYVNTVMMYLLHQMDEAKALKAQTK